MTAEDFYTLKVRTAKQFGFPEPIYLNTEKLTGRTRVLYIVEVQATHIPDRANHKTHHYSLKFSKFAKQKEEPFWIEEDITTTGFSISDRASIEKLAGYIQLNKSLLEVDLASDDFASVILSRDETMMGVLGQILSSDRNRDAVYKLFKDHYPELDKKILTYKLAEARHETLKEFHESLPDTTKRERNYWDPFLKKNQ